ncbi:WD40/YVTN/BNR-like repeat-containing protein [Halocola ammonii]
MRLSLLAIFCLVLFASCKKKVIEITTVLQVEKEMQIPIDTNVRELSFPAPEIGFALPGLYGMWKTTDGGNSWTEITQFSEEVVEKVHFFNEQQGVCFLDPEVMYTDDGGATWTETADADFMGAGEDGEVIIGEKNTFNSSFNIEVSHDYGNTFQYLAGQVNLPVFGFKDAAVADSLGIVMVEDESPGTVSFNLYTGEVNFNYEAPSCYDIYIGPSQRALINTDNRLETKRSVSYGIAHTNHTYPYYGLDGYGNLMVAVGKNTITSNYVTGENDSWTEVFTEEGNGFTETFYSVEFIDSDTFFIGGEKGKIIKASL